ncbi:MAG: threonine/serine exporter family protein [Paramuribaculum sp.]|nr:threonine/serine exporter family protein [Paramuribaculum sp.]MDE5724100.1 threonine/serine exporter family protein [Paramuribaculum sp.]MDE5920939.1 threonine/serine exporter family protein [Paramuribaculum sp.]
MDLDILSDAFFAALAAIGFSSISRLPLRAYPYCAAIAALGHSLRYILMIQPAPGLHIFWASLIASFLIGLMAVMISSRARTPAEACFFPALLPMIPGMYAYKAFGGLAACVLNDNPDTFGYYFYQAASNGFICMAVLIAMVTGATLPIFMFKKISFQATR